MGAASRCLGLLLLLHLGEAFAAIDGSIALGLEGHSGLLAASGASGGEILSGATGGSFSGVAAGLAALGLVLEATLGIKFLLTGGENKFIAAFFANECFVLEHDALPLFFLPFYGIG